MNAIVGRARHYSFINSFVAECGPTSQDFLPIEPQNPLLFHFLIAFCSQSPQPPFCLCPCSSSDFLVTLSLPPPRPSLSLLAQFTVTPLFMSACSVLCPPLRAAVIKGAHVNCQEAPRCDRRIKCSRSSDVDAGASAFVVNSPVSDSINHLD